MTDLAFSTDSQGLAWRDNSGRLVLWDIAGVDPIPITLTARTPLDRFPAALAHPITADGPTVSLLSPVDLHPLTTLLPLPDAAPYALDPPSTPGAAVVSSQGSAWIAATPDGYFAGSANVAAFIAWTVDGVLYPAVTYWDVYYRPDLVRWAAGRTEGRGSGQRNDHSEGEVNHAKWRLGLLRAVRVLPR